MKSRFMVRTSLGRSTVGPGHTKTWGSPTFTGGRIRCRPTIAWIEARPPTDRRPATSVRPGEEHPPRGGARVHDAAPRLLGGVERDHPDRGAGLSAHLALARGRAAPGREQEAAVAVQDLEHAPDV